MSRSHTTTTTWSHPVPSSPLCLCVRCRSRVSNPGSPSAGCSHWIIQERLNALCSKLTGTKPHLGGINHHRHVSKSASCSIKLLLNGRNGYMVDHQVISLKLKELTLHRIKTAHLTKRHIWINMKLYFYQRAKEHIIINLQYLSSCCQKSKGDSLQIRMLSGRCKVWCYLFHPCDVTSYTLQVMCCSFLPNILFWFHPMSLIHTHMHASTPPNKACVPHIYCLCMCMHACVPLHVCLCKGRTAADNRRLCLILEEFEVTANLETWGHCVWSWTPDLQHRCSQLLYKQQHGHGICNTPFDLLYHLVKIF